MNCIILDDEPHAIEVLVRYVGQTPSLTLKGTFRNPLKALEFLQTESVQLIFLDINMPNLTGMQFLQSLYKKPLVIFTTAYPNYAAESYEWNAVDYLVKPILFERFLKGVNKAIEQGRAATSGSSSMQTNVEEKSNDVFLKSGTQTHRVRVADIRYIYKESNYLEVHTLDKKIQVRANMGDIFSWLPVEPFCRIHKSFVVALKHVETIEVHQVRIGKTTLPIGASYRDEFMKRWESRR
jgi:DNA-binding LytR/AlgR family response regulator